MRMRLAAVVAAALTVVMPMVGASKQGAAARGDPPADLLIVNGKLYPGKGQPFQEAVAVRGNRIVAVGGSAAVEALRGPRTEVLDARGAAVVAGFNDIHTHLLSGGLDLDNVDLQGAQTLDDLQSRIRSFSA